MIQTLEQVSMEAWPALEAVERDGWVLRFSQGYTRRANSVHPLHAGSRDLTSKIEDAEKSYREHSLPPTFKMTSASEPEGLDAALAQCGYEREAGTSVRIAPLTRRGSALLQIETSWDAAEEWREAFHRMSSVAPERRELHNRMLHLISYPVSYASLCQGDRIAACGLGVVQDGWLGIFDVVVDECEQRRGLGERLMCGLMAWGCEQGARRAYLQVMLSNVPALALYDKLGFREAYQYWYRVRGAAEIAVKGRAG